VKKYIQYAKSKPPPVLTKGAADYIVQVYASFRNMDMEGNNKKTSPLTARTLETLIRLSTAHAKARLSTKVEEVDARQAEEIMRFALFQEVPRRQRRKKRKLNDGAAARKGEGAGVEGSDEESESSEDETNQSPERMPMPAGKVQKQPAQDPSRGDESQDIRMGTSHPSLGPIDGKILPERLQLFRSRFSHVMATRLQDEPSIFLTDLLKAINEGLATDTLFGTAEATEVCQIMQESDEIMISDGIIYIV